jgi:hypothetical protein
MTKDSAKAGTVMMIGNGIMVAIESSIVNLVITLELMTKTFTTLNREALQMICEASQIINKASQIICKASQTICKASQIVCKASQIICKASQMICKASRRAFMMVIVSFMNRIKGFKVMKTN